MNTLKRTAVTALVTLVGLSACGQTGDTPPANPPESNVEYVYVGPNWASVHSLKAPANSFAVKAQGPQKAQLGDELVFSVTSERAGRLWVVQVDPADELSLLLPNAVLSSNEINVGQTVQIPPAGADWTIEAAEPLGKTVVAFIVTQGDLDMEEVLNGQETSKALQVLRRADSWSVGKIVVDVAVVQ